MIGEVEIENLKSITDVSCHLIQSPCRRSLAHMALACVAAEQLWLDNQSTASSVSSLYSRLAAAFSGLRNAFFGQTRSRARLNVIASYDQSNELFKVRSFPPLPSLPGLPWGILNT